MTLSGNRDRNEDGFPHAVRLKSLAIRYVLDVQHGWHGCNTGRMAAENVTKLTILLMSPNDLGASLWFWHASPYRVCFENPNPFIIMEKSKTNSAFRLRNPEGRFSVGVPNPTHRAVSQGNVARCLGGVWRQIRQCC